MIWGVYYGVLLVLAHIWRSIVRWRVVRLPTRLCSSTMFIAVSIGWVFFRSENFTDAVALPRSMSGVGSISVPERLLTASAPYHNMLSGTKLLPGGMFRKAVVQNIASWIDMLAFATAVLLVAPNTHSIVLWVCHSSKWRKSISFTVSGLMFGVSLLAISKVSPFLYFRF